MPNFEIPATVLFLVNLAQSSFSMPASELLNPSCELRHFQYRLHHTSDVTAVNSQCSVRTNGTWSLPKTPRPPTVCAYDTTHPSSTNKHSRRLDTGLSTNVLVQYDTCYEPDLTRPITHAVHTETYSLYQHCRPDMDPDPSNCRLGP